MLPPTTPIHPSGSKATKWQVLTVILASLAVICLMVECHRHNFTMSEAERTYHYDNMPSEQGVSSQKWIPKHKCTTYALSGQGTEVCRTVYVPHDITIEELEAMGLIEIENR